MSGKNVRISILSSWSRGELALTRDTLTDDEW